MPTRSTEVGRPDVTDRDEFTGQSRRIPTLQDVTDMKKSKNDLIPYLPKSSQSQTFTCPTKQHLQGLEQSAKDLSGLIRNMTGSDMWHEQKSIYTTLTKLQKITDHMLYSTPEELPGYNTQTFPFNGGSPSLWIPDEDLFHLVDTLHSTISNAPILRRMIITAIDNICLPFGLSSGEAVPMLLSNFDIGLKELQSRMAETVSESKMRSQDLLFEWMMESVKSAADEDELKSLMAKYEAEDHDELQRQYWVDEFVDTRDKVEQVLGFLKSEKEKESELNTWVCEMP